MNAVTDNPAEYRFELPIDDGAEIAAVYYRQDGYRIVLSHTIVPERFSGQGLGARLARGVFDAIRASHRKAVLLCPFMAAYYARHSEYADIIESENQND